MSLTGINSRLFHTTFTLSRPSRTLNDIGDAEFSYSVIGTLPAALRPAKVTQSKYMYQGIEYTVDKNGYVDFQEGVIPKNGDRITDSQTGDVFDVIGVEDFYPANASITVGHHLKLYLQIPRADKS